MLFPKPTDPCCVCHEEITGKHFAECTFCLKAFHLRMTENAPEAKDCGTVEVDDDWTMKFTCLACYETADALPATT